MHTLRGRGLIMVLVAALGGCTTEAPPRSKAPTPVRVRTVAESAARGQARYSGTVEAAARVDLAFKVGGYVREVAEAKGAGRKLQEGDFVGKGTVLAVVNESDYRQKLSAAQASLAEAIASEKQAQVDYERAKRLVEGNVINKSDYDAALAKRDVGVARVAQARANVSAASLALGDCVLRAPFDGVVIRRTVEVGLLASPGTPAFTIADTRNVKVVFGAPDTLLPALRMGEKLGVHVEALNRDLAGEITRIAPSADSRSRSFDVEATLPNGDDQLKVGMIVSIQIPEAARAAVAQATPLALPLTAVVRPPGDRRGFAVFVVEKQGDHEIARVRTVELGDMAGSAVQVARGVAPGERVIETGATLVADGETVRVVR